MRHECPVVVEPDLARDACFFLLKDCDNLDKGPLLFEFAAVFNVVKSRVLCLRSDKFVCMRCIATPFSSVAKSKPRWKDRNPVAMSVRLPRASIAERRDIDKRLLTNDGRAASSSDSVIEGLITDVSARSCARLRRLGSTLRIQRMTSISVGVKLKRKLFAMYRGNIDKQNTIGIENQKIAEWKR